MIVHMLALLLIFILTTADAALWGINSVFGANETETIVRTVNVDTSKGTFKQVTNNFVYLGDSGQWDGISAFDQHNEILYYTADFESSFIFSIDVKNNSILPPISISADYIFSILRDNKDGWLFITGEYSDHSVGIMAIPDSNLRSAVVNLTQVAGLHLEDIYTSAFDESSTMYYLIINKSDTIQLASFPLSSPKSFKSVNFPCGNSWEPIYLASDATGRLIGLSTNQKGTDYEYFEIANGKCTTKDLKLDAFTYDPVAQELYYAYAEKSGGNMLEVYNTNTYHLTQIQIEDVLADLEVSYSTQ